MSKPKALSALEIINQLKLLRSNIKVDSDFFGQVKQIDKLLKNDKTGIVSTILDFQIHSATVPLKIETRNESLNDLLQDWQTKHLNRNVNIDIPGGMRELSAQYYRERWRSSLIALKVIWGKISLNGKEFNVPTKMWFLNGGAVIPEDNGSLNTKKYYLNVRGQDPKELTNTPTESIFIRRPYNAWHELQATPYLVRRGAMFNALFKNALKMKQSDLVESIIPYLLSMKAGNDTMMQYAQELMPSEEEFMELKKKIVHAKEKWNETKNLKELIGTFRYDVELEHLIPDLTKFLSQGIMAPIDKDLLASLGLIELQGFSSTRQEAILNPKVLVEEVKDAVMDWASLLEDVVFEMMRRNEENFPNLTNNTVNVIPGTIKAFITDDMRSMLRSVYDRGLISKKRATEDITEGINFEVEIDRRDKENEENLNKRMQPPVIQNLERWVDPDLEDQDKTPGSPESDNFYQSAIDGWLKARKHRKKDKEKYSFVECGNCKLVFDYKSVAENKMGSVLCPNCGTEINQEGNIVSKKEGVAISYETVDDLPNSVKDSLSVGAQMIWLRVFNSVLQENGNREQAIQAAWAGVSEKYEKKSDSDKWVKKTSLEDYKSKMSKPAYKLFTEVYESALNKSNSEANALNTALAVLEKTCQKNNQGLWVRNRSLTKTQMEAVEDPNVLNSLLELELKERKLKLLDKLLKEEN